jgi:hypothetical protein
LASDIKGLTQSRVLRRIFGPKRDEATGSWRKLHEELHNLYSSPNIITVIKSRRIGRACSTHDGEKEAYTVLVGKPEGKRPLGRPTYRWEDSIKMDFRKDGVVWTVLIRLRIGIS